MGALTGLRRLSLSGCCGVSVDAVRRLPMVRHVQVILDGSDRSAAAEGWRRVMAPEGEAALRADMPQLEDVHVSAQ